MSDQEDFESLSRRLAAADFSADSRIRASLRAKLLGKRRAAPRAARVGALALALAAVGLLLLLPFRAKLDSSGETRMTTQVRLPPERARGETPAAMSRSKAAYPRGENGLPVLPGRFAAGGPSSEPPPISTRAIDRLIETRRTSLDEIFVTRRL